MRWGGILRPIPIASWAEPDRSNDDAAATMPVTWTLAVTAPVLRGSAMTRTRLVAMVVLLAMVMLLAVVMVVRPMLDLGEQ